MAFLDDIDRKLTAFGQEAIQKTKKMSDHARISMAIRELEEQKRSRCEELGRIYYNVYKQDQSALTAEAAGLADQIYELDVQIREQKEMMKKEEYCPGCGSSIPLDSVFCNKCGYKIAEGKKEGLSDTPKGTSAEQKVCCNCGKAVEISQLFCVYCGTPVK